MSTVKKREPGIDFRKVAKALGAKHVFSLTGKERADIRSGRIPGRVAVGLVAKLK